jgi:Permuted papain-like amidase enzyme, YaeF/YiiX, C92 family
MKRFVRFTCYVFVVAFALGALSLLWIRSTAATASDFKNFKRGDVIFQTSTSSQSLAILLASNSRFSHMGIIDFDTDGKMVVLEATLTTRETPIVDWVGRGAGGRIAVYRLPNLSELETKSIAAAGRAHLGKPYDLYFYSDENELYCSEFVHLAFKVGAAVNLGEFQKIGTLNLDNFAARRVIKRRWQRYPLCENGKAKDFEACLSILQSQELITPSSIAADKQLERIYNNYP